MKKRGRRAIDSLDGVDAEKIISAGVGCLTRGAWEVGGD